MRDEGETASAANLARATKLTEPYPEHTRRDLIPDLARWLDEAEAREREACAALCEQMAKRGERDDAWNGDQCETLAQHIRERST